METLHRPAIPSRRRLLTGVAAVGGALLCAHPRHWRRAFAAQAPPDPVPIPGRDPDLPPVVEHFWLPGPGKEPSTLYNFNGLVAVAEMHGAGTDQNGNRLLLEFDNRVLAGEYVAANGTRQRGTFAFI